jgi:hypothetical protein
MLLETVYGGRFVFHDRALVSVIQYFSPTSTYDARRVDMSSDGRRVALEDRDRIFVFDASSGSILRQIDTGGTALALSAHGERLAVGMSGGSQTIAGNTPEERRESIENSFKTSRKIAIFDVTTGRLIRELKGHDGQINSLEFSPDGNTLFSAGLDKKVRVWDLNGAGDKPIELTHPSDVWSLELACGKLLTSDGTVRAWSIEKRSPTREFGKGTSPSMSMDCSKVAAIQGNHVVIWNAKSGEQLGQYSPHDELPISFVVFSNQDTLTSLGGDGLLKTYPIAKQAWYQTADGVLGSSR